MLNLEDIEHALTQVWDEEDVEQTIEELRWLVAKADKKTSRPVKLTRAECNEVKRTVRTYIRLALQNGKFDERDVEDCSKQVIGLMGLDFGEYIK